MRGQLASSTTACTTAEGRSRQLSSQVSEKIAELAQLREEAEKANSSYRMVCCKPTFLCLLACQTLKFAEEPEQMHIDCWPGTILTLITLAHEIRAITCASSAGKGRGGPLQAQQ